MKSLANYVEQLTQQNERLLNNKHGEQYDFPVRAMQILRTIEQHSGDHFIADMLEVLSKENFDGAVARAILGYLNASVSKLNCLLPQDLKQLITVLEKHSYSNCSDVLSMVLSIAKRVGGYDMLKIIALHIDSPTTQVRLKAIRKAAELAYTDKVTAQKLNDIFFNTHNNEDKLAAYEGLVLSDDAYLNAEHFVKLTDDDLQYLNTMLDLGSDKQLAMVEKSLSSELIHRLPFESIKRINRLFANESAHLESWIPEHAERIRDPLFGLILHRDGFGGVGHAGIYVGKKEVIDCNTSRDPSAVRRISYDDWLNGEECWGFRKDKSQTVDLEKAVTKAFEICSWRTEYDGAHNNQKGKWFTECVKRTWYGKCVRTVRYWESDCVGFTEYLYEQAGGNPTPNKFESGRGWPLTPSEQADHMDLVQTCH